MSETISKSEADTSPSSERALLELEELRLRVKALRARWWQRPATTAPIATIVAATCGVLWAILTGFFSVQLDKLTVLKQQLQLQTDELKANRDRQSLVFKTESQRQQATLASLQAEEARLRHEIERLDQPIVTLSGYAPMPGGKNNLLLRGVNFHSRKGAAEVHAVGSCGRGLTLETDFGIIRSSLLSWSDRRVVVGVLTEDIVRVAREASRAVGEPCSVGIRAYLRREDGKRTVEDAPLFPVGDINP